ncbi:nuclear pore complex protein An-Nup82 [Paecilomyces variotii No. 5]|uniref:Nuclear pore complex protein An-Nup82 n=1 Tax=Byssochlamys spectabilis (strain No. 5 / NBRC 109023) TaxID=1356009 RepID=V5FA05_BYSSN|nr:nuclear pore complex protein An-Nup82 [Paecilomyces variotii No. 5]
MPKVISYTPPWLCRPSPGARFFTSATPQSSNAQAANGQLPARYEGPTRILAKRGSEVFAVVDNQIRWSNLTTLKDEWQLEARSKRKSAKKEDNTQNESVNGSETGGDGSPAHYRVLTVPVYGQIKQLIPSPNGAFLAIVTAHTVHISVLPDSSHLSNNDPTPIRLKTYQLGPTAHVIPESPVVSALWHPLGIYSNLCGCIVTVTADAAVRVWELDRNNHWSFDRPTLAIDLKKLVDGTSCDEDFTPSGFGKNKGFSADAFDMEVASACFGGSGHEGEAGWAPMTLWVAMRPGDLYALCPLLPSKWQAPSTTIPSLSAAIVPKLAALEDDATDVGDELTACRQQFDWLREIDSQDTLSVSDAFPETQILTRPAVPSAIPRLQGPFRYDFGDEVDDLDLTDIHVIAAKVNMDELMTGEEEEQFLEENAQDGLSATVICVSTASGRVDICLELDGVEGQWLPKAKKNAFTTPISEPSDLVLLESLETVREKFQQDNSWPTFTPDVHSRYSFFLTTANNVTFISLSSWVQRLEAELQSEDASGSAFRLQVLCEGSLSLREQIIQAGEEIGTTEPGHLSSSLVFYDYDLGYLLLTYRDSHPYAALLDAPAHAAFPSMADSVPSVSEAVAHGPPVIAPRRAPYQVPSVLYAESPLQSFVEKNIPHRHRHSLKEQVRLSPSTLDLVTAAHRLLSSHTNALERAASDLFRRCERLKGEMHDQLKQLADVAERIKGVSSEVGPDGQRKEGSRSEAALDKRLQAAKDRQEQLVQRYESIRNKVLNSGGRPLSEKEKAWMREVETLSHSLEKREEGADERSRGLGQRLETAKDLAADLLTEVKRIATESPAGKEPGTPESPGAYPRVTGVPARLQRARLADAMRMVERETAVIDAITSRLERLNTSV